MGRVLFHGPAWAVVSLTTMIALFYTLAPAAAAEPHRVRLSAYTPDFIDAPWVTVQDKVIRLDGVEVDLESLQSGLKTRRELTMAVNAHYYEPLPGPVVIYQMAPDTPALLVRKVDEAGQAAGFPQRSFIH